MIKKDPIIKKYSDPSDSHCLDKVVKIEKRLNARKTALMTYTIASMGCTTLFWLVVFLISLNIGWLKLCI